MTEKQFVVQFLLWYNKHKSSPNRIKDIKLDRLADHALLLGLHMLQNRKPTPVLFGVPPWIKERNARKSEKNAQKIGKIVQKFGFYPLKNS